MNREMRRRLEKMEKKFCPDENKCGIVFHPLKGESDSEYDERVARWYAGEEVEGQKRPYTGPNQLVVMRVVYVSCKKNQDNNGQLV